MGFGLKKVARAVRGHGLITTDWEDSIVDGLGAMVGAWRCYEEAKADGTPVMALPLMEQIRRYNEVDCQVMQEAVEYFEATSESSPARGACRTWQESRRTVHSSWLAASTASPASRRSLAML
ncbi:MAG: hypothetical protein KJ048_13995 [Dehalococcoidia bacterium]|nr:hypothetical protein [Dehalococcoidia bacterium]